MIQPDLCTVLDNMWIELNIGTNRIITNNVKRVVTDIVKIEHKNILENIDASITHHLYRSY